MSDDMPNWAPNQMPELEWSGDGPSPFDQHWAAAKMANGAFAVCLEASYDEATGQAQTIAMCPTGEFAQYIAYFHNMLLKGARLLKGTSVEDLLKGYAAMPPPPRPEETGGYL